MIILLHYYGVAKLKNILALLNSLCDLVNSFLQQNTVTNFNINNVLTKYIIDYCIYCIIIYLCPWIIQSFEIGQTKQIYWRNTKKAIICAFLLRGQGNIIKAGLESWKNISSDHSSDPRLVFEAEAM